MEEKLKDTLSVDYDEAIIGLIRTPAEYDAYCLHQALDGLGLSDPILVGILCTRDAKVTSNFFDINQLYILSSDLHIVIQILSICCYHRTSFSFTSV